MKQDSSYLENYVDLADVYLNFQWKYFYEWNVMNDWKLIAKSHVADDWEEQVE